MKRHQESLQPAREKILPGLALRNTTTLLLAVSLLLPMFPATAAAQVLDTSGLPKAVRGQVAISRGVNIAPSNIKVSLNLREAPLTDVLNMLAEQGKFNIILDDSVQGKLTVDIKNIPINKALEYLFTVSQLSYTKDGNTIIVAAKETADAKNFNSKTFKAIPVLYKDAESISTILNNTIFKVARPDGSTTALSSFDRDSNSLLVMGSDSDIKLAGDALRELDMPHNRKVYHIKHNTANYVASVLAANFFTPLGSGTTSTSGSTTGGSSSPSSTAPPASSSSSGSTGGSTGNSSSSSGSTNGAATGGVTGGSSNSSTGGGAAGSTGAGPAGSSTGGGTFTTFSQGGVTFIAEPYSSTLTVLATDEQLSLIDSIIDQVDVRRPQAEIEVSLVEIQDSELKSLKPSFGALNLGKESSLVLNAPDGAGGFSGNNIFTFNRNNIANQARGLVSNFSLTQNHETLKGKVIANPTIVAMDGQSSTITITDQVPSVTQTIQIPTTGPAITTTTISTQDAGVTLKITPTISNDGSVTLSLQPEVSQPGRQITAGNTSTVLISKRTLNIAGVRIQDGETLVIGGLLRETKQSDVNHIPGLDKLPIVSAMFRTINSDNKDRTELVLMVTPHILRENAVSYFNTPGQMNAPVNPNTALNLQPVPHSGYTTTPDNGTGRINPAESSALPGQQSRNQSQLAGNQGKPNPQAMLMYSAPAAQTSRPVHPVSSKADTRQNASQALTGSTSTQFLPSLDEGLKN